MSKKREKRRSHSPVKSLTSRKKAISEDFRRMGVTAMSAGLVGLIITGDMITAGEAVQVLVCGAFFWLFALILIGKGD